MNGDWSSDVCSSDLEKLEVIFENLRKCKNLPEWLNQQIDTIHKEAIALFPNLITPSNESPEIEEEANRWFQRDRKSVV